MDKYAANKTFCQHCKAIQKVMNIVAPCLYKPLDEDYKYAFCEANIEAVIHLREVIKNETNR
jgi:hypothetical protein